MTIQEAKTYGTSNLTSSPSAALDTNCILEYVLGQNKTWILLHARDQLTPEQESTFLSAIETRKTGLPVAYITGHKEFYGYDFLVTPAVLIPKPDTEILVEEAVNRIFEANRTYAKSSVLNICDMCSGSGCIGIAVYLSLKEKGFPKNLFPNFTFADISPEALSVTKENARRLIPEPVSNLRFVQTNLFQNLPARFDFILTNPPYIPASLVDELLQDGRREPRLALDGDVNPETGRSTAMSSNPEDHLGLGIIRKELPQIYARLDPMGQFLMETGEYNAEETKKLAQNHGFKNLEILRDLEGQLRVVCGSK